MSKKIRYLFIPISIASAITAAILILSIVHSEAAAQSNKQGGSSSEGQGIPGTQENANPLSQAPIGDIKVKPPNNATSVSPLEKGNITGTLPPSPPP
jgi:hypothetical protein